jgi:uncharacterized membrane protein
VSFDTDDSALFSAFSSLLTPSSDVLFGTLFAVFTLAIAIPIGGVVRAVLGLGLVLFFQGYAVVAALFPARPGDTEQWVARRVALPFGVSFVLLPLSGLALAQTGVGFSVSNVLGIAGSITIVGLLVAARRRVHLPPERRDGFPVKKWTDELVTPLFTESPTANVVNALTVLAVATAVAALAFTVAVPAPSPSYARFSVLTEDASGEAVASGYPTNLTAGEGEDMIIEIANQGPERQSYTVIAQLQRYDSQQESVTERSRVRQFRQSIGPGETWNDSVTVTPEMTGQEMRLVFLLYADEPPEDPTIESAEEHLFLWVNVTASDGTSSEPISPPAAETPAAQTQPAIAAPIPS